MQAIRPSAGLKKAIISSIRLAERRRARAYFAGAAAALAASSVGVVLSAQYFLHTFFTSEFYGYATLVLSDSDALASVWKDALIALAESIPALAIAALLAATLALLASVRTMADTAEAAFTRFARI